MVCHSNPSPCFYPTPADADCIVVGMEEPIIVRLYGRDYSAEFLHEVDNTRVLVVILDGPWQNKTVAVARNDVRPAIALPPPASGVWAD